MLPNAHSIFFSPTATTKTIVTAIVAGIGSPIVNRYDLTKGEEKFSLHLDEGVAVIGVPVYAGRVPELFLKRIENLSGNGIPAVLVVLFGNRAFEDALVELRDVITAKGFMVIGAAAFIGEHSYSTNQWPIAANRPDGEDLNGARAFGQAIATKLQGDNTQPTIAIPGNTPYKERVALGGICPETNPELCTLCSTCASVCPLSIISVNQQVVTQAQNCIMCCACVKHCSHQARTMRHPMVETRREMLVNNFSERKEPSLYL